MAPLGSAIQRTTNVLLLKCSRLWLKTPSLLRKTRYNHSHTFFLLFFSCFVIKWQSEVSMANEQLAIFFRSSSIVLRQCVIPAAQTLVNSHATGNVSSSSTVIHGFNVILLIILSPALIIGWSLKLWQSELLCKFQDSYTTLNSKRSVWILNWGENLPVIICRYKDVRGKM